MIWSIVTMIGVAYLIGLVIELCYYVFFLPHPHDIPINPTKLDQHFGRELYIFAHILSPLRLPLGLVPYCIKLGMFFLLKKNYKILQQSYTRQAFHVFGDFLNLFLTFLLVKYFALPPVFYLPLIAELLRLTGERGQMIFSGIWQILPHRKIASYILAINARNRVISLIFRQLMHYCEYYSLTDEGRLIYVTKALHSRALNDPKLLEKLQYFRSFHLLSKRDALRGGAVRDVANGDVFINPLWTSDPWLLIGLAIRRAPWMFDPRYLTRPFYYRTVSARIATRIILEHARFCPPFIVYQFGHEIKDARYGQFYGLLHHLGIHIEEYILSDGTYPQDHLFRWLEKKFGRSDSASSQRILWSESEVVSDVIDRMKQGESFTSMKIALEYTYPVKYIDDILMDRILTNIQGGKVSK